MEITHDHMKLSAAEISYLWSSYLADSMSICFLKYFLENIDDPNAEQLTKHALDLSEQHVEIIRNIFNKEGIPIPVGFTEKDVYLSAKRLFTDTFYMRFIFNMSRGGLVTYGRVLQNAFRDDVRSFYLKCLTSTIELNNEATQVLLKKGLALRPPAIPYPKKQEFVHKQSFILEGLGRRKPLTGTEVTNLHANIVTNQLGKCIAMAFSQVASSEKVRNYFIRGKELATKHSKVFSSYLEMHELPIPMSFNQEVTDSTQTPFSDKLMMFHFSLMIYAGIGNYGVSISESQRSDLVLDYSRLTLEVLKYSEDGANIMISEGWLEQPPLTADRRGLVENKQ